MELVEGRAVVGVEPSTGAAGAARFEDVDGFVARLADIREAHGAAIQAFDARYVAGSAHLERAVALATRAHERDDGIADDRAVEFLLYAAGRRQINRALEMGVGEGETPVVVVVDGGDEAAATEAVRNLLAPATTLDTGERDRIRAFFDVSLRELEATDASLEDLVCERVALLVVEK